jgi:hypothetical protein
MSVHAGTIITVGGNHIIERVQSAGLGDARTANDVIREVGNEETVDKVPQDPDYTFTLESFDVSADIEAFLVGQQGTASGGAAALDADGTAYSWLDCGLVTIPSPRKDPATGSAGAVQSGHLVPGYYPTRIRYRFGVTDNATTEVELAGGSYYYAEAAPIEQFEVGDGATEDFVTDEVTVPYRRGGAEGTSFKRVFGVIVDGELQTEGVDYVQTPDSGATVAATVSFTVAPATGADIRFAYFTTADRAFPQSVHASTIVKPGAVRGRNICVYLGSGSARQKVGSVQSFELEATVESDVEREFCNEDIVGRTINGRDCTGTLVVRSKNSDAFFALMSKITGVARGEVIGFLNTYSIPLEVAIENPKNPAQILKTLYVDDAILQVPGTPARVNTPTDFSISWESRSGKYLAFKGAKP